MKIKRCLCLLLVTLMLASIMTLGACTKGDSTDSLGPEKTDIKEEPTKKPVDEHTEAPEDFKEAPMLAAMVSSGEIPILAERLPDNMITLETKEEIGEYGSTFYGAFPNGYAEQAYQTLGFYEPVLNWNDDVSEQLPNIIESFEQSDDAKTFTMTIRKGIKWSNGDPLTTEDIKYQYNDVLLNEDLTILFPTNYTAGGKPYSLTVIDEYKFQLTFEVPNPTFRYIICRQRDTDSLFVPSNYLKQFNNKYVDEVELAKMAESENLENWLALYNKRNDFLANPERPTLYAWVLESVSDDDLIRSFVRNPYYFKVDPEGNQLPYLDYVQVEYVDNSETLKLKVMAGEVDYIFAPTGETFSEWPMLAENADTGNYRLILASGDYPHIFLIMPNLSSQDPQKGPLFRELDFRVALSHAINREELISLFVTVADFKGVAAQQSPVEESPFYDEKLANQYLEYDVDKANNLLDGLGLTKRDSDGYRLGLDGSKMAIQLTIPTYNDLWVDGGNLIAKYWREVGLNVETKAVAPDIWSQMNSANELEITILSSGSGGTMVLNTDSVTSYACPMAGWPQHWGTGYGQYITSNGESGVEPPEFVYELNRLREEVLFEADQSVAEAKFAELLDAWGKNFTTIGVSRPLPMFLVCSNDLLNTPEDYEAWVTFNYGVGGNVNPCQFYKK